MNHSTIKIQQLSRFPIKGLTSESLTSVTLSSGEGMPGDRLFGFARYNSGFDTKNPQPLPKNRFVVLLNEAALAHINASFDQNTQLLKVVSCETEKLFDMNTPAVCKSAEEFMHSTLGLSDQKPPVFVSSAPHRFTDVSVVSPVMMNAISVLNLASVRELEKIIGEEINPTRFRANIEIDGLPPFAELESIGSSLSFAGVKLKILSRTKRCAATEVNPVTAERDIKIPYLIHKHLGHADMGIYAEVEAGGQLSVGQTGTLD
jgi:uncharacterized protein YcbX